MKPGKIYKTAKPLTYYPGDRVIIHSPNSKYHNMRGVIIRQVRGDRREICNICWLSVEINNVKYKIIKTLNNLTKIS